MKKLIGVFIVILLFGCATAEQQKVATEGIVIETNKTRDVVMNAVVQLLTEEGYAIDNINEKFGLISCKPYKILSGELMKKLDEVGGGFVAINTHSIHIIDVSAVIDESGGLRFKSTASTEKEENIFSLMINPEHAKKSQSIDVFRTEKLQNYYIQKIKERLKIQ